MFLIRLVCLYLRKVWRYWLKIWLLLILTIADVVFNLNRLPKWLISQKCSKTLFPQKYTTHTHTVWNSKFFCFWGNATQNTLKNPQSRNPVVLRPFDNPIQLTSNVNLCQLLQFLCCTSFSMNNIVYDFKSVKLKNVLMNIILKSMPRVIKLLLINPSLVILRVDTVNVLTVKYLLWEMRIITVMMIEG